MKFLRSILKFFINPFSIGIIFTCIFTWTAFNYYATGNLVDSLVPPAIQNIRRAHQYSIDLRLKARGLRGVSDQVAILTVDEKALQQEGRWPWPRAKIKKIIDRMVEGGASALAFDIVFAEPDRNEGVMSLENLRDRFKGDASFNTLIEEEIQKANTDRNLTEAVKVHSEKLILGSYFDEFDENIVHKTNGYKNLCINYLFQLSPEFPIWSGIAPAKAIVTDTTLMTAPEDLPSTLAGLLGEHLQQIAKNETEKFLKERSEGGYSKNLNSTLKIELDEKISNEQARYCTRWLVPESEKKSSFDENLPTYVAAWDKIKEEDDSLKNLSSEDGLELFKNRQMNTEIHRAGRWWLNLPEINQSSTHMAYFNAFQDEDGVVRSSKLFVRSGNILIPSLALRTYLVAKNYIAQVKLVENARYVGTKFIESVTVTDDNGDAVYDIPANEKGELTINYAGPQKMFPYISAADVLSDDPNVKITVNRFNKKREQWEDTVETVKKSDFYKDRIFVFGATATGIYDLRVTPFEKNYPGVETHANLIDNLLRRDFLVKDPKEEMAMMIFLAIGGLILTYVIGHLGAVWGLVIMSLTLALIYFVDKYFLFGKGTVVTIVFPVFLTLGLYFVLTIYKYFTEERSKKHLKGTFGKYVSPAIVEEILSDPSKIELGGSKEHITVFFSDVRGFTTISEKLDAASLSSLLNSYLTPMTNIIFENKGTLDKYMGDAIMAFFGAPIRYTDHANYACRCALQNIEKLKLLQQEYVKKGLPMIDVGIGINTGEMSVGNMGSDTVRNYTVMGDAVNLGSRLEGINKEYGTRIIVSEFTKKELSPDFITREIDRVRVKGKLQPIRIFELIGEGKPRQEQSDMINWFDSGVQLYLEKNWDKAIQDFSKALDANPADPVSKLYVQRCQDYKEEPPPHEWDGVFVMKTK